MKKYSTISLLIASSLMFSLATPIIAAENKTAISPIINLQETESDTNEPIVLIEKLKMQHTIQRRLIVIP